MTGELVSEDGISIRLAGEADVAVLASWLADERVAARFGGRDRVIEETASITDVGAADGLKRCIVEVGGLPIGYVQYYAVDDATSYGLDDGDGVWATDQFIGIPEMWGHGFGSRFVRLLAAHLCSTVAKCVVTDPAVSNQRAVRAYEKAGFLKVKVLREHEVHEGEPLDCWLMEFRAEG